MLEITDLNIFAVVAAWLLNIILGSFWYSPAGFGKLWSRLSGVDMMKIPKNEATKAIVSVMLSAVIQTVTLAVVINSLGVDTVKDAVLLGLLLWAGFTAATTVGNNLYSRLSWKFWWLNASFFLITIVTNSVLLALWK